ncbi:glutamate--tRNA ligase [Candidatus Dependentiae bacterium]|nr:glutamate--tRNA ligase [Candidatus Dependentiae bacterium]
MSTVQTAVRVRFAPSPTGLMHLGNVRSALMNYLFAKAHNGTFIVRIEDTDANRNFDPRATAILDNISWLGLDYQEGPGKEGAYGPYYQSERTAIYQEYLDKLITNGAVYRCFCTPEELEIKRERQIALKKAPRYDRTCATLDAATIAQRLATHSAFIWRFAVDPQAQATFIDMARGAMTHELAHFSDFPLTRADGSFTFIFANCVDDIAMRITHVLRGHEHLSNTVHQILLYQAFNATIPVFWHLPLLFGANGKKLSKRDFGFSLNDLIEAGFLPQALTNYLAIIGASFTQEIMSLEELAAAYPFTQVPASSTIKYDVEKLRWVNHKWISRLTVAQLAEYAIPFIAKKYPAITMLSPEQQELLLMLGKSEYSTLHDIMQVADLYYTEPVVAYEQVTQAAGAAPADAVLGLLYTATATIADPAAFIERVKQEATALQIPLKSVWPVARLLLTGSTQGYHVGDLLTLLGADKARSRITKFA